MPEQLKYEITWLPGGRGRVKIVTWKVPAMIQDPVAVTMMINY